MRRNGATLPMVLNMSENPPIEFAFPDLHRWEKGAAPYIHVLESGEPREVHARLGVADALQHAANQDRPVMPPEH